MSVLRRAAAPSLKIESQRRTVGVDDLLPSCGNVNDDVIDQSSPTTPNAS